MLSLKADFGAVGDGICDDTTSVQAAFDHSSRSGEEIFAEVGKYLCGKIYLKANMNIKGENKTETVFVCKSGTNGDFFSPFNGVAEVNDIILQNFTIDGNWSAFPSSGSGNISGDTLIIAGYSPALRDLIIKNSPGNGLLTKNATNQYSWRIPGISPHITNIMINQIAKNGWVHSGQSDLWAETVLIVDTSLAYDGGYYGLVVQSNGRFANLHPWNCSHRTVVAAAGVLVQSSGNSFVNCHFEGSKTPLVVTGSANVFDSCAYYGSRGGTLVSLSGSLNKMTGTLMGSDVATFGIQLSGSFNMIDMIDSGCTNGAIKFMSGESGNIVKVRGYHSGQGYVNAPSPSTDVDIMIGGAQYASRIRQIAS